MVTIRIVADIVERRAGRVRHGDRARPVVHGAVRELRRGDGRGTRQGAGRRAPQDAGGPRRPSRCDADGSEETVPASQLRAGDLVMVTAGELIPGDGDIDEGIASVDESAITGESAPVIRESGGDRSAVTAGTKVLSDWIKVRITAGAGRVVPRPDDRARRGRRAPEDAERDRAVDPAREVHDHLPDRRASRCSRSRSTRASRVTDAVLIALFVCLIPTTIGGLLSAIGIAGMDRLVQHNVLAMSGRAVEAAGDVSTLLLDKTGTITLGNRQAVAFLPAPGVDEERARRGRAVRVARRRDARGPVDRRAGEGAVRHPRAGAARDACAVRPVHGADPDERRRPGRQRDPQGRGRRDRRMVRARDGPRDERGRRADRPRRGNAARRGEGPAAPRRDRAEGHHQGRAGRAVRAAAEDGDPHGDDHRRQPAHRRRDRAGVRASTTSSPRRPPRRRWP